MSDGASQASGPDLSMGVALNVLADGEMLAGHVGGEPVLLVRRGADVLAVHATCTHYGGPLAEGLLVGDTVRCPWHHACFNLRTGAPVRPPALNGLRRWRVEQRDPMIRRYCLGTSRLWHGTASNMLRHPTLLPQYAPLTPTRWCRAACS
jgi:nitrite reductase/ring-hydroxylating ferredoxin subunit